VARGVELDHSENTGEFASSDDRASVACCKADRARERVDVIGTSAVDDLEFGCRDSGYISISESYSKRRRHCTHY